MYMSNTEQMFVLCLAQEFFPGLIHVVYVIRPNGFLQKAISEVSNKFFKEDFKFKVIEFGTCLFYKNHSRRGKSFRFRHRSWVCFSLT